MWWRLGRFGHVETIYVAFVGLELILQLYDRLSEYVGFTILVLGNIITWKNYVNVNVWSIDAKRCTSGPVVPAP